MEIWNGLIVQFESLIIFFFFKGEKTSLCLCLCCKRSLNDHLHISSCLGSLFTVQIESIGSVWTLFCRVMKVKAARYFVVRQPHSLLIHSFEQRLPK